MAATGSTRAVALSLALTIALHCLGTRTCSYVCVLCCVKQSRRVSVAHWLQTHSDRLQCHLGRVILM